jgi:hypothetical protein
MEVKRGDLVAIAFCGDYVRLTLTPTLSRKRERGKQI